MNPLTAEFLRASAALAVHAQAHPTDADGLRLRRVARNRAETAWAQAGAPDAPANAPTPTCAPSFTARPKTDSEDGEKDWTPITVVVEVARVTEKALLLRDGEREFWCPRTLIAGGEDLNPGDVCEASIPMWVVSPKPRLRLVTGRQEA